MPILFNYWKFWKLFARLSEVTRDLCDARDVERVFKCYDLTCDNDPCNLGTLLDILCDHTVVVCIELV